ncbi:methionyl-tRNA synthetase-like protein [Lophium mytilinum]|uniref:Probable methionine--tRNA ligase, mitochondrial n=1 Tax=Lophium mytilinum TaxID=390894 RepID=A0A6A6R3D8_9PEZI|nr:methionyl-tRNA synthetase-like protein [Lophium mytilinum]
MLPRAFNPRSLASVSRLAPWTCASCKIRATTARPYSAQTQVAEKPYYITSPIFYVNAAPHVGHLYTMVLTDIHKRWQLLQGKKAILCTGTDEHGMKIQQASAKAGMEPKPFCDKGAEVFKSLAQRAEILNDHFVRTTDKEHREAVEYAWFLLQEAGYIYTAKHEGWYSVSDETFYPQSTVQLYLEPATGRKIMTSIETGKEVEWTSEINYHFKLSAFKQQLLDFYKQNPKWIVPEHRMKEVVQAVESGLEDLSISRPSDRLTWGIPVPEDESQTIYVWLDALMNYVTKAGYPWPPGKEQAGGWPADCQVIGKDIVRFHCIYWPAFLLALGLPLPKHVLTHAHWTLGKAKMAKSTGNVVNPFFAIDRFGIDVMRFYLAHDGGIVDDADYSNYHIIERYKHTLNGSLGNLASRVIRGKGWNVSRAVRRWAATTDEKEFRDGAAQTHYVAIKSAQLAVQNCMDELDARGAVQAIVQLIQTTNAYFSNSSPWNRVKESGTEAEVDTIIYLSSESLRVAGILLQPVMPNKSALLLDMLGVDEKHRSFDYAEPGKDAEYGVSKVPLGKGLEGTLFPPLDSNL